MAGTARQPEHRGPARHARQRRGGIGGVGLLVVLVIGYFLGVDVTPLLQGGGGGGSVGRRRDHRGRPAGGRVRLGHAGRYRGGLGRDVRRPGRPALCPPVLVLFKGVTQSACGGACGATGPFYCPLRQQDLSRHRVLHHAGRQLGAGGDFAAAYVVAHEVAHHVQDELGILGEANRDPPAGRARQSRTRSRCGSSCRPIATRGSGRARPRRGSARWSPATSTRR